MFKFIKFLIKITFLLAIVAVGFVAYRLWDKGQLSVENMNWKTLSELFKSEGKKLGDEVRDGSMTLIDKIQNEWVDWEELKGNWTLSEDEFEDFKRESLAFLSMSDSDSSDVATAPPQGKEDDPVLVNKPATPTSSSGPGTEPKKEPVKVVVKKDPVPPAPKKPRSPYPNLEKSRSYTQGMADLEKAKEYNRKGLPGKPNAKGNLKKAVSYYKKSQKKMVEASRISGLSGKEKAHIDKLQEEISKQIYWGTKLGSL